MAPRHSTLMNTQHEPSGIKGKFSAACSSLQFQRLCKFYSPRARNRRVERKFPFLLGFFHYVGI